VTLLVVRGASRARIAEDRGVSAGTVKSQLKTIFDKVGVGRESEIAVLSGGLRGTDIRFPYAAPAYTLKAPSHQCSQGDLF